MKINGKISFIPSKIPKRDRDRQCQGIAKIANSLNVKVLSKTN
ncbi:MAG: hypothetical protein ACFBSE_25590 [Prochloraceae cyanobacterium]